MGERHPLDPRGVPGDGRGRQGLDHRARHVRREPPRGVGGVVQGALERGARPHVPLADPEERSRAGPHRDLQPLAVRGGHRAAGAPGVAREAAPPRRRSRSRLLGRPPRRPQRLGAPPRPQRHQGREAVPARVQGRAEEALHGPARQPRQARGSSTPTTSRSGPAGTTTWPPTRTPSPRPPRSGRRGTSCRRTTSTSCRPSRSAILVDTIEALDLQYPTVSDKDRERNAEARRLLEAEPS